MKQFCKLIILSLLLITNTSQPLGWINSFFEQPKKVNPKEVNPKEKDSLQILELLKNQNYTNLILYMSQKNAQINRYISNKPKLNYIVKNNEKVAELISEESFLNKLKRYLPIILRKDKKIKLNKIIFFIKHHLFFFYGLKSLNKLVQLNKEVLLYENETFLKKTEVDNSNKKLALEIKLAKINYQIEWLQKNDFVTYFQEIFDLERKYIKYKTFEIESFISKESDNFKLYVLFKALRTKIIEKINNLSMKKKYYNKAIILNKKCFFNLKKEVKKILDLTIYELLEKLIKQECIDKIMYSDFISSLNDETIKKMTELIPIKNSFIKYEYENKIIHEPYDNDLLYIDYQEKCYDIMFQFLKIVEMVINYQDLSESSKTIRQIKTSDYRKTKSEKNLYRR
jgi:hypothetical protein